MRHDATARQSDDRGSLIVTCGGRTVARAVYLDDEQAEVYAGWLRLLNETGIPYAVGGAFAAYGYTGAWRDSKDLDVFLRPEELKPALDALRGAGFSTEITDPLWLAKVHARPALFMDLLFAVRHTTRLRITLEWFERCRPAELLGEPTRLLGPEEVIATKVYLAARDRFDGADIAHLIRSQHGGVDWEHILHLLGGDDEILLWQLLFFTMAYPGLTDRVPAELMERAFDRVRARWSRPADTARFRGMLLDPEAFAVDVDEWGYEDRRDRRPLVDENGEAL